MARACVMRIRRAKDDHPFFALHMPAAETPSHRTMAPSPPPANRAASTLFVSSSETPADRTAKETLF